MKRSYGQYCGLAKALDVLGERWTLLIVRELLPGPRRYRELSAQLPDIATDLLTARLRTLTEHGLADRLETGGVGGGVTYRLTPAGHELRKIIEQLATIGLRWFDPPATTSDQISLRWALATARMRVDPTQCPTIPLLLFTPEMAFQLVSDRHLLALDYLGSDQRVSDTATRVEIRGEDRMLVAVITGNVPIDRSHVSVAGDNNTIAQWLAALRAAFPTPIAGKE